MAQKQKVALVTGSALNIGRQIALHLALEGYRVMTTARRSETDARETAPLVREAGSDADTHMADIADHAQAAALVDGTVRQFGRLDVLVNNASMRRQTRFAEMTSADWREILGATLDGAVCCAHAATPHIVTAGGASGASTRLRQRPACLV
jgi:3-oxoacyl-[acyl-carrier protein] reductase